MKEAKKAIAVLVSALIWATVMIVCSSALKESGDFDEIRNVLLCGAFMHIMLLSGSAVSEGKKGFSKCLKK
ncbi:hypothetical protein [Arcticibacterium luteifluviistationis]|uniref:Uncharacterized protein n=1 Tax=Arcticibacterium luteifluviistationis TaxID=1784714 RepID=A0A2Z4G8L5_9BACT|nr:hypothetical protein [Arcticibacterium luteifluviistationis]AWV97408.1 hypothetical protein DJ013_04155 [Arcticibacterium luteifluviistationis]